MQGVKQGELSWVEPEFMLSGGHTARKPKNRASAAVRASVVAKKRVTTVEPRDAGKKERRR